MTAPALDESASSPIVFFDGACPLCNRSVAFLARHDRTGRLFFAHLQGELAARSLDPALRSVAQDATVVLLEPGQGGRVSVRSAAVLGALAYTGVGWRLLARATAWPGAQRALDVAYAFVARHRDAWFGRHDTCALPDPSLRARFID
jgi:predicted DCC family thiol-disulfide oxidoreductase YuxK